MAAARALLTAEAETAPAIEALLALALALGARAECRMAGGGADGALADLSEAVDLLRPVARRESAAGWPTPAIRAELSSILGFLLAERHSVRTGAEDRPGQIAAARADRNEAIGALQDAMAQAPAALAGLAVARGPGVHGAGVDGVTGEPGWDEAGEPGEWAEVAEALGRLRYARYDDAGPDAPTAAADLDSAVRMLSIAVGWAEHAAAVGLESAAPPAGEDDPLVDLLEVLVPALADRWGLSGSAADREALIARGERLLGLASPALASTALPSERDLTLARYVVAMGLIDRADSGGDGLPAAQADLDAAIAHLGAVAAAMTGDADRAEVEGLLAHACWQRLNGDSSDHALVDAMTAHAREAWRLSRADPEERLQAGLYMAAGVHERLIRPGEPFDHAAADEAIEALAEFVPTAEDPGLRAMAAAWLGNFLAGRGQATGSAADLSAAQPWLLQALDGLEADDPQWAEVTQTLAAAMTAVAGAGFSLKDVDEAIRLLTIAAARSGADRERAVATRQALGQVLTQRSAYTGSRSDLDDGIAHLQAAWDLSAAGDHSRITLASSFSSALVQRYMKRGDAQDLDAAEFYHAAAAELARDSMGVRLLASDVDVVLKGSYGLLRLARGMAGDRAALSEAVDNLRAAVEMLPPGHPYRERMRSDLALALMTRYGAGGQSAADLSEGRRLLRDAAASMPTGHVMHEFTQLRTGGTLMAAGYAARDPGLIRDGAAVLAAALGELRPGYGERVRFLAALGGACQALHELTGDPAELQAAIGWLEEARQELSGAPGHTQARALLMLLARCHRVRGDAGLARERGLAALRQRGREALLQTGTERALSAARLAAEEAAQVAGWCLEDGEPAEAVAALELGRGLILHAATAVTDVPGMLEDAGHPDLAAQWRAAAADRDQPWDDELDMGEYSAALLAGDVPLPIPDDLRERALAALAGQAAEERLLSAPGCDRIAAAAGEVGADAVVYLFAPGAAVSRAILVRASDGEGSVVEMLSLPLLDDRAGGLLDEYAAASAALAPGQAAQERRRGGEAAGARWRQALERVCDWAYPAAIAPLLAHVGQWGLGRPARLVLVPSGRLSLVPWHAARGARPGQERRHACVDAVISYAASGRQLAEVAGRGVLSPRADPMIVGNPGCDLPFAEVEALAIREACYPGGRYLGHAAAWSGRRADGPGTPDEVLAGLPSASRAGASVLHLGCHAVAVAGDPGRSHLALADGSPLTVESILRQARGRPARAPGGVVSLAACMSDIGGPEHDEALTLATSFLAAGASAVVGARWDVSEVATALLMYMFHHHLAVGGERPADALRLAQLWMLDPGRTPPPGMPQALASDAASAGHADLAGWAAFTHQGR